LEYWNDGRLEADLLKRSGYQFNIPLFQHSTIRVSNSTLDTFPFTLLSRQRDADRFLRRDQMIRVLRGVGDGDL